MKKPFVNVTITKEVSGYSAFTNVGQDFIGTEGESYEELKTNILEAINLALEERDILYSMENIRFTLDLPSFFEFYKIINAKALSQRIGMNQSLLAQYITGRKRPSPTQTRRILKGVQQIGKELSEIRFLM
jgi:predicted RNase H-like HicB family nuclease